MPGPPRTPTKVLEARGSWLAPLRSKTEPRPETSTPRCPAWLSREAKAVFKAFCGECKLMGVLARSDGATIARYADLTVRYIAAAQFLAKYGESYPLKDEAGNIKCFQQFPQVAVVSNIGKMLLAIECQFGLTPASRSRVQVAAGQADDDDTAKFFKVTG